MLTKLIGACALLYTSACLASFTPADPLVDDQWYLDNINAKQAWSITKGKAEIKIVILDSSPLEHPDITWLRNSDGTIGYDAFNDVNNAIRYPEVDSENPNPYANFWHGLHVAGIIGGNFNGQGMAGICPSCSLIPVNITNNDGLIDQASMARGVQWAIEEHADIINISSTSFDVQCSLVSESNHSQFLETKNSIAKAIAAGIVVVAAAGNTVKTGLSSYSGNYANRNFPASCPGVINVSATNKDNRRSTFSPQLGASGVVVYAPGGHAVAGYGEQYVNSGADSCTMIQPAAHPDITNSESIVSLWANIESSSVQYCYRYANGTSMSAPIVSGVAGLMLSVNRNLSNKAVENLIKSTGITVSGGSGKKRIDAQAAVSGAKSSTVGPCSLNTSSVCYVDAITEFKNTDGSVDKYFYAYGHKWHLDKSNKFVSKVKRLDVDEKYGGLNRPCEGKGQFCKLDTVTTINLPGEGFVESVTSDGRGWNFRANGTLWPGNPFYLKNISRFANGPCSRAANPDRCKFDTRVLVDWPGLGIVEAITAYDHYYLYQSGALLETGNIRDVARWANGPCSSAYATAPCKFDARNVVFISSDQYIETVIAYGRLYEWKNGVLIKNVLLTADPVYK